MLFKVIVKVRFIVLWCYKKELGFSRYEFILRFGNKYIMLKVYVEFFIRFFGYDEVKVEK